MCEKLTVSRSGFYAWVKRTPSEREQRDRTLEKRIAEHFESSNGVYGSPRIHALLRRGGDRVGRKRVVRIVQSMNRPKTMTDNAHVESFFHSLKTEAIHGKHFGNRAELDSAVRRYIEHYNRTRIHSSLNYRSPIDYERPNARN